MPRAEAGASQTLTIAVRPPLPWLALLSYLSTRLIEGVETVDASGYTRSAPGYHVQVTHDARRAVLNVRSAGLPRAVVRTRITQLFSPQHDGRDAEALLARSPLLAARIARCPGFRPLGCWSAFELCVRTLVGQQVSVAAARTLLRRLIARCGALTPDAIIAADLSALGMPGRRVAAIRGFAEAVRDGDLDLDHTPWPQLDAQLASLPGFGPWTRAYLAIRLGRDADAFPDTDIGLLRATGAATPRELRALAEAWRPYRGHAATLLWALPP